MSVPGYRFLFATYPFEWRVRYQDEVLAVLLDADALEGRRSASMHDRLGFFIDGLAHQLHRAPQPVFLPLLTGEHRFDQSNGLSPEREQTAFENEHSRWWDRLDQPTFVPVGFTGGRPQERT